MNLAELVLAQARVSPDVVAVRQGEASITFTELAQESDRVAFGLRELGVQRGDRVLMFADNRIEHLVVYLAVARLGAVFAPVHSSFQAGELEYVISNCQPAAVIAQDTLWERLRRAAGQRLRAACISFDHSGPGLTKYANLGRNATASAGIEDVPSDAPVLICFTSGSTDRPQPVARSHAHEIWNARMYADVWDYRAGDVALVAFPLSWVWGLSTSAEALLAAGATVVLHTDFDARAVLAEIERSRVTLFAGTMSMFTAIHAALTLTDYDLSSLRHLYRGGEPINDETVRSLESRIGVKLIDAYATTEASPVLAVDPLRDRDAPVGTVGRLVDGAEIRLVDPHGNDVPRGQAGEALLRGPEVMLGYWNEPELTATRMTADGWFRSGDLLIEGDDGYYFVLGRTGDVIIRNGAKIAPAEIEAALTTLPGVADSVVVGTPDDEFGENIVAWIQLNPGCIVSADDVYDHLSDRIARFKLPSVIVFVDDLPLRGNQKRDRAELKQRTLDNLREQSTHSGPGTAASSAGAHLRLVD